MVTEAAPVLGTPVLPIEAPIEVVPPIQEAPPIAAAPPAPVATEAGPSAPVAPEVQQYIGQLEETARAAQAQADLGVLEQVTTRYAEQLEQQQGFTPEQAQFVARREGQQLYQLYQSERVRQGQINAAFAIGMEHGVDPRTLMNLPTPEAMLDVAQRGKTRNSQTTRIAELEAQVAKLTKGSIPAQRMESGAVGAGNAGLNEQALEKAVAAGTVEMTPAIAARLQRYWNQ